MEDKKNAIEKAGKLVTDDDLNMVAGGSGDTWDVIESPRPSWCPHCNQEVEPDGVGSPHDGWWILSCEKCNGQYKARVPW